jgi:hypothetical protein
MLANYPPHQLSYARGGQKNTALVSVKNYSSANMYTVYYVTMVKVEHESNKPTCTIMW